jgi:hypothetical protein
MPDGINEDIDLDLFDEEDFDIDDENESGQATKDPYEELVARAKREAEEAVVAALTSEDTNSGVYKGLQKVLSKRDRELEDLKRVNSELVRFVQESHNNNANTSTEVEFIKNILPQMLDDESRQIFNNKRESFIQNRRSAQLEEQLRRNQMQQMAQQYQPVNTDNTIAEYKKQALNQMKEFVELYGLDPTDKRLDFGDEESENLTIRLGKLKESMTKIKKEDEDISSVRRKPRPTTKTRGESSEDSVSYGQDLVKRGMAQMLQKMRES